MRSRTVALAFAAVTALFAVPSEGPSFERTAEAAGPTPLPAAKSDEISLKVQAFYDKSNTFLSDFTQEYFVKSHNLRKTSKGTVAFAKPGKMDWVYQDPKDNRVVSDGSILRVYEAANKQMYEQPIGKSQYPAALAFLTGSGKLRDVFNFELFAGEQMNFPGGLVLVGTPKQPTPAYQKVLFYVDAASSQVRRVLLVDGQGNRNRFDFVNPRINEPLKADRFTFSPPPGTQVIRP